LSNLANLAKLSGGAIIFFLLKSVPFFIEKGVISKVNEDLNSDKQLNLTNIIETKKAIEILHEKNQV